MASSRGHGTPAGRPAESLNMYYVNLGKPKPKTQTMTVNQTQRLMRELRLSQGWIAEEGFFTRWGWNMPKDAPAGQSTPVLERVARYPLFMAVSLIRYRFQEKGLTPRGKYAQWAAVVEKLDDVERHIQQTRGWHYTTYGEVAKDVRDILASAPDPQLLDEWLDCPGVHVEEVAR